MGRRKQHCPKKSASDENEAGNIAFCKKTVIHYFSSDFLIIQNFIYIRLEK